MKGIYVLLVSSIISIAAKAQDNELGIQNLYRTDFAVPDQPAFKLLGDNPGEIMRPSSINELSIVTSQYYVDGSISLPRNFAFELNPALLLMNDSLVETEKFMKKGWLYKSGISIGTQRVEMNGTSHYNFSVGYKMNLIDKGNLLFSGEWRKFTRKLFEEDMAERDAQEEFLEMYNAQPGIDKLYDPGVFSSIDPSYSDEDKQKINEAYEQWKEKARSKPFGIMPGQEHRYREFIEEFKKNNWNQTKLDVAIGNIWASPDSTVGNLKAQRFGAWISYAFPLPSNKNWGQMMLGGSLIHTYNQDTIVFEDANQKRFTDISLSARYYVGRNRVKGFVEGLYSSNELENTTALFNFGIEINPIPAIWFVFSTGWESIELSNGDQKKGSSTKFDLRFNIPENFNLF